MDNPFSWEAFKSMPVVGILRNAEPSKIETLSKLYLDAGLTTLEVTMNSDGATESIASLRSQFGSELNIGAGTVCTMEDLDKALASGAGFIVTPIIDKEIIEKCVAMSIPVFPGAYSPTEIYTAWKLGASMVKVFPAGQLGAGYIKEILAPLNQINLLPTGGVSVDNFGEFFKAGAQGVGMGSHLLPKNLIENDDWKALSLHFSGFVKKYKQFRNEN